MTMANIMDTLDVDVFFKNRNNKKKSGNDLLSHQKAVPSALKGLTSVFGMGTGGSPSL